MLADADIHSPLLHVFAPDVVIPPRVVIDSVMCSTSVGVAPVFDRPVLLPVPVMLVDCDVSSSDNVDLVRTNMSTAK